MDNTTIGWAIALGLGFPMLSLVLAEFAERLDRKQHPLAGAVRKIRRYVLTSLAALLVMQQLLKLANTETPTRLVATATWIASLIAGVTLINALFTTAKPSNKWQIQIPNLLFQVTRSAVVFGIAYYVLTGVWQIDLSKIGTVLGLGSVVIALALQSTLSNLVSGFLLLVAKPFKTGDWIEFEGIQGRVIEQNWWSVKLQGTQGRQYIVPNGNLAKATLNNYEGRTKWFTISVSFSYDDPPFRVISALNEAMAGIEFVSPDKVMPMASSYDDSSIKYDIWYAALPEKNISVLKEAIARIYYVAQRYNLTIPYPINIHYQFDATQGVPNRIPQILPNRQPETATYLRSLPFFFKVDDKQIEQLVSKTRIAVYGKGELVTREGQPDDGLYIILSGQVQMQVTDEGGKPRVLEQLRNGGIFGEMALFPGELCPVTTIAEKDTEVLIISPEEITRLIQINPQFAADTIQFIEERRRNVQLAKGTGKDSTLMTNNGRRMSVQK